MKNTNNVRVAQIARAVCVLYVWNQTDHLTVGVCADIIRLNKLLIEWIPVFFLYTSRNKQN